MQKRTALMALCLCLRCTVGNTALCQAAHGCVLRCAGMHVGGVTDASNVVQETWPRAAAIAERLWSARNVK